ncbi:MAG: PQQ-binding-like beta-propeller repeat protein [Planctomycetes bacterium]|nr:PQQ-binding-like beta-propeller repeat protein [Planctomycetota bacterium]
MTNWCLPLALLACAAPQHGAAPWPQGSGPHGDWTADGAPPTHFSATTGENIVWRTPLPETGQGGIAIAGGRLFVTTMAPWTGEGLSAEDAARYAHATEKRTVVGKHIDAHGLDAATGELLWTRRIEGEEPSIYSYPFSDATSASPCADARHVWFTNGGGQVVCMTHGGDVVWSRRFTPTSDGPFNKQFEPFLIDDPSRGEGAKTFVHMEPVTHGEAKAPWNFLLGLDAATGAVLWTSDDALTHYNAPILVATDGGPCVLHARGGPHDVPERPVGLSLTRATGPDAGTTVWRYEDPRGNHEGALQTMAADERFAYWLLKEPNNVLVVLDVHTGAVVREISLIENVHLEEAPAEGATAHTDRGVTTLDKGVFPARYSMHAAAGKLWFLTYATAWGKPVLGAPWCLAAIDAERGAVHYRELPTSPATSTWRGKLEARAIDSRGDEVTGDQRSRWDGWDWVFHPSPTQVGDVLFCTLQTGIVYAIDVQRAELIGWGDLGAIGETWTGNSVSFADGRLYHRTARELLCIGAAPRAVAGAAPGAATGAER